MHEPLHRASISRRHVGAALATVVAAAFFFSATPAGFAETSSAIELSSAPPPATVTLPRDRLVRDIAIETVSPGQEGLELSARLTEDGGVIQRPIRWTVTATGGEPVFTGEVPTADAVLPPGDYTVAIRYGAVNVSQQLTLVAGTRLIASFVLDAGGLRILPRLAGDAHPATAAHNLIYALSGEQSGTMIATSDIPGEVIRLPAGDYRIESRYDIGNADAITDVRVKAGIMSAVEIDHKAGLAHLAFVGAADTAVHWRIVAADGETLPAFDGLNVDAVLKPGSYTATADTGSESLTARFDIAAGQTRDIMLGN